ncbi:hypothetical protein [Snodgrassella communis]|jgi:hypothetical protein|uniref:hypothetical protein n=1 Tax=Snodgrassella communis TaxID=2946699 RepID=UPI000C1F069D|nr:hypothetical protein [Snodgrassella communis]PIT20338.1 hypothetical protein BGI35_08275 [Snodgrassella communis]
MTKKNAPEKENKLAGTDAANDTDASINAGTDETQTDTGANTGNAFDSIKNTGDNEKMDSTAVENWAVSRREPEDASKAKVVAVRNLDGSERTYWRSGIQFNNQWKILQRKEVKNQKDWTRIVTDSQLEIRAVVNEDTGNVL